MSSEIEMSDLSQPKGAPTELRNEEHPDLDDADRRDYTISIWAWTSATLLFLLALCLILSPRLLLFVSETSSNTERRTALTPLESFLALQFGILLSALSMALIFNIPSTSPAAPNEHATPNHPLLVPVGLACTLTAFLSYNTSTVGPLAFTFFLGSTVISLWSLWVIIFAESSSVSKKTGADKHTSSFIFGNKAAASSVKKRWRKEQKAEGKSH
jgi:hypothetical protein